MVSMPFCQKCGNNITEDQKFCPECGTSVSVVSNTLDQQVPHVSAGNVSSPSTIFWKGKQSVSRLIILSALSFFLLLIPVPFLLWSYISKNFIITGTRIQKHEGILRKKIISANMSEITDVRFEQGIIARMLGYGTVYFNTAGTDVFELAFENVPNPNYIVNLVQKGRI